MQITIARGERARLPCIHRNKDPNNNKVRLVLWYRNDTSRPFISYDARINETPPEFAPSPSFSVPSTSVHAKGEIGRIFLEDSGQTLSIVDVVEDDQAEYRCTVHYSNSPSVTRRLKLIVVDAVQRVQLLDGDGHPVGAHVGPFSEGSPLNITCKAFFSCQIVSIEWQMEGKRLESKWRQPKSGVALSSLYWNLNYNHSLSTLTCRLICNTTNAGSIDASIVDASTTIIMYYVPKATMLVSSAISITRKSEEKKTFSSFRIKEGQRVTFICLVKARPPPYNISWLHNGRIITPGNRRSVKENTSLVLSPVVREDAGLYTCLASNREGDGHSNAVSLKVDHPPYCIGEKKKNLVVIKNKPVTLSCKFLAQPHSMNFSWSFDPSLPVPKPTVKYSPKMQRYTPNPINEEDAEDERFNEIFSKTEYFVGKHDQGLSLMTFTPRFDNQGVICYAKNEVGRTRSPCGFTLKIVDPPDPPKNCRIERVTASELQITCVVKHFHPQRQNVSQQSSPGISYVLSPEARTSAHLEVRSRGNLIANLTNEQPVWHVKGLPPDSNISLRIYAASQYARSSYVDLLAKPGISISSGRGTAKGSNITTSLIGDGDSGLPASSSNNILILLGSLIGGVILLLLLLVTALFFIRRRSLGRRENILSADDTTSAPGSNVALESAEELEDISVGEGEETQDKSNQLFETEA